MAPLTPTVGCLTICLGTACTLFLLSNDPMAMPPGVDASPRHLQLIARIEVVAPGTQQRILDCVFSNDGRYVVCAYHFLEPTSAVIKAWEVDTRKCVLRVLNHPAPVGVDLVQRKTECICMAPDDTLIYAAQTDGSVFVFPFASEVAKYNLKTPVEVKQFLQHWKQPLKENFDASDMLIHSENARAVGKNMVLYPPTKLVLMPSSQWLVSNGGYFAQRCIVVWSAAAGRFVRALPSGPEHIHSMCVVPNEKQLLTCTSRSVKVWNLAAERSYLLKVLHVAAPLPSSADPCPVVSLGLSRHNNTCITLGVCTHQSTQLCGAKVWNVGGLFFPEVQIRRLLWESLVPDVVNVIVDYIR